MHTLAYISSSLLTLAYALLLTCRLHSLNAPSRSTALSPLVLEGLVTVSDFSVRNAGNTRISTASRLASVQIGAGWCLKDLVYRVEGPVFEPHDELRVRHMWRPLSVEGDPNVTYIGCYGNGGTYVCFRSLFSKMGVFISTLYFLC